MGAAGPRRGAVRAPKRGDVYVVDFDPARGSEIAKTRPALIIQNDIANRYSPVTIVAAFTSQFGEKRYPTEVLVQPPEGGLTTESAVLLNQLRTVDKIRLRRRLGAVTAVTMAKVDRALVISIGLRDL